MEQEDKPAMILAIDPSAYALLSDTVVAGLGLPVTFVVGAHLTQLDSEQCSSTPP